MSAILTLAAKDLKVVVRDKFALFWLFAFPLGYALFFGSIFGNGDGGGTRGQIRIAIVDEDRSEPSRALAERLADHDALRVDREPTAEGSDGVGDVAYASLEDARAAVRAGQRVAYLHIPPGYGDSPFAVFDDPSEPVLELGIDPSRSAETGMLRGIVMQSVFEGLATTFTDAKAMREQLDVVRAEIAAADDLRTSQKIVLETFFDALDTFVTDADFGGLEAGGASGTVGFGADLVTTVDVTRERRDGPRSAYEITFPSAVIWGLMTASLTFAITLVRERTNGTLLRLRIAPISRTQLLAGKALGCFGMCMIVMVAVLGFGVVALDVRFGNPLLVLLATASTGLCFTGMMMVASVMGRTEQAVTGAAWGALMPLAMVGGGMIPLVAMPSWLLALSDYSPIKWGILAMEGAIWRGFTLADMVPPCGILVGIGALFFALGVWIFRRMDG